MPIFVVQKHHASHLHYDLRIEMDSVLKSWAVPKEIPVKPDEKRLAIAVDDHPLEYADFEGTIPEGMYGAGKVEIYDRGECTIIDRKEKKLVLELEGKKIKGTYVLLKTKEKQWLLFRKSS